MLPSWKQASLRWYLSEFSAVFHKIWVIHILRYLYITMRELCPLFLGKCNNMISIILCFRHTTLTTNGTIPSKLHAFARAVPSVWMVFPQSRPPSTSPTPAHLQRPTSNVASFPELSLTSSKSQNRSLPLHFHCTSDPTLLNYLIITCICVCFSTTVLTPHGQRQGFTNLQQLIVPGVQENLDKNVAV